MKNMIKNATPKLDIHTPKINAHVPNAATMSAATTAALGNTATYMVVFLLPDTR